MDEELIESLSRFINKDNILVDEPMKKHTTFKIGGPADYFIKVKNIDTLKKLLIFTKERNIPLHIIGNGSNLLVLDKGVRGIVAKLDFKKTEIIKKDNYSLVTVSADIMGSSLSRKVAKQGLKGMEFLSGIPCTIGGAVRMNAGAYKQEIKDTLVSAKYLDENGEIVEKFNNELHFGYRTSMFEDKPYIIIEATFKLEHGDKEEIEKKIEDMTIARREKQPIEYPSAGSTFKRKGDIITAKLIDDCGLKGYTIGGAAVSLKHAGFIINKNNATAKDVLKLVKIVKRRVFAKYNIEIELEMLILGE